MTAAVQISCGSFLSAWLLAGAALGFRAMLVSAAATQWAVEPASLTTASGMVYHAAAAPSASYASLTLPASKVALPALDTVPLKPDSAFKIIGTPKLGVDAPAIVEGRLPRSRAPCRGVRSR